MNGMSMNKQPLISIIVVTKNSASTLGETLRSIKAQTYKNVEVIAIDGASTDNTVQVFKKYNDILGYLVSEPDKGVYDAMNKGIRAAKGDIIYFLNSNDSLYSNDVLQKVVYEFTRTKALIVYGDIYFQAPKDKKIVCTDYEGNRVFKYSHIKDARDMLNCGICHQVVFYNKKIFDNVGLYDLSYPIYADHDLNIRAWRFARKRVSYLPETIANFELGGLSTNAAYAEKQNKEHIAIARKYRKIELIPQVKRYYLLGILIWKITQFDKTRRYYLFGFLQVFKIRG